MTILRWRSGVPDPDLPFLEAVEREPVKVQSGERLECPDCDAAWTGDSCCFDCGKPGLPIAVMKQLRAMRALQDESVPV